MAVSIVKVLPCRVQTGYTAGEQTVEYRNTMLVMPRGRYQ